jgi:tetratricopeptide (TPR) repeat protein
MCAGHYAQALPLAEKALRPEPAIYRSDYQYDLAIINLRLGKRDEAVERLRQILIHQPDFTFAHGSLAVIYADGGREEEARAEAAKWLKLASPLTIPRMRELLKKNNVCAVQAETKRALDTLERLTNGIAQSG